MILREVIRCLECKENYEGPDLGNRCPECLTDNIQTWHYSPDRVIPEGKVWKFVFEVSHAPHFVIEHDNGTYSGIYAPIENVQRDNQVPFGIRPEAIQENIESDHIEVNEIEKENSPWKEDAYR